MFTTHLVFADIDGHSQLCVEERTSQIERFWAICDQHQPPSLSKDKYSFFDIDNDSLMAGFSDVSGISHAGDVLSWAVSFHSDLLAHQVPTTFALNIIAPQAPVDWTRCRGFRPEPNRLYIPDDIFDKHGRVLRSRLVGDALIVTSRLLELAKRAPFPVVFAYCQTGTPGASFPTWMWSPSPSRTIGECTGMFDILGPTKSSWLSDRRVRAWALQPV